MKPTEDAAANPAPPNRNQGRQRTTIILLSLASMALAALCTLVAKGLVLLIAMVTNLAFFGHLSARGVSPAENHLGLFVILIPVGGGIIIGLMARYGSKAIRGHGIPEAMEQILQNQSRIAPRVTLLKPLSAAISIGTGGPFGAEGPIIATGGALGSLIGQIFNTTAVERKTLLAAGAAAGMTAIFGTPISAILLAVELLLFEFTPRSLIPVSVACGTAAALRIFLFGGEPAFAIPALHAASSQGILAFAALGGIVGAASAVISGAIYWVEEQFERLPIHWMWWPALGGVAVGAIGFYVPRTLGVGYENIEDIISNRLPLGVVAALCTAKLISWAISLGSGTSGGTLAPLLTIGGGLGALIAAGLQNIIPGLDIGLGALVGMAAMFAGASRAFLASVAFAFEATRQPEALPALLVGATCAFILSHLIRRDSIMTEKIVRRGVRVPEGYESDLLRHTLVSDVMTRTPQILPADMKVAELAERIAAHDPEISRHQASLLANNEGELLGIITRGDLIKAIQANAFESPVSEAGSLNPVVTYPGETVHQALAKLLRFDIGRLPVVNPTNETQILGYLGRSHILAARATAHQEEAHRQKGWATTLLCRSRVPEAS